MTSEWISEYLCDCVARNVCTTINCTTCGSHEFRNGLAKGLGHKFTSSRFGGFERSEVLAIASALKQLPMPVDHTLAWEKATRFIIMDLWTGMPILDQEVEELLANSWAGEVLQRMKAHHHQRQLALDFASPERVQERRAELKARKQLAHQERLAIKTLRDLNWRAKRPPI